MYSPETLKNGNFTVATVSKSHLDTLLKKGDKEMQWYKCYNFIYLYSSYIWIYSR
jgi:hypothetical protein